MKELGSYFGIFHGKASSLNRMEKNEPCVLPAVEVLLKQGEFVGQRMFDEQGKMDTLIFLTKPSQVREEAGSP